MRTRARTPRARWIATDDPRELSPPRLPPGTDIGWAVSELLQAAWLASGKSLREFMRSPRDRRATRAR